MFGSPASLHAPKWQADKAGSDRAGAWRRERASGCARVEQHAAHASVLIEKLMLAAAGGGGHHRRTLAIRRARALDPEELTAMGGPYWELSGSPFSGVVECDNVIRLDGTPR